ncbi:hypothetical protein CKO31_24810 [Thiohalocapsa halophila]|uniref:Uncharacterized protein n=1 Tax=Thiohalocapsa halophila TaxID=69359 RepID=A0ABS1CQX1_9GAMM|nr:hypothetical protein [Thiohalocapsa halophila]MBK1633894.1 hypothetical protein [Thiohalocapsa halophila]
MTRISVETQVSADHRLQLTLPDDFPAGPVKVTVEPVAELASSTGTGESPLGQRLRAIRDAALAEGMPVMTQDEVLAEVRRRRGEPVDDD